MRSSSMAVHWEQRTYGELDAAEQLKTFGAELVELETHAIRHFGSEQAAEGRRRMDIKGGRPAMRAAALVLRDSGRNKPLGTTPKSLGPYSRAFHSQDRAGLHAKHTFQLHATKRTIAIW